ncbi:CHAT domain-containing protein [Streptomyces sp. NPDC093795]|uniref:CHAT domain-containing protein n=1 Tax=Streptomyces sp. NPDC093795 TaxID=3366051 RepID=UPI003803BAEF
MFGCAVIRLWAAEREELSTARAPDGPRAATDRILQLGSQSAKVVQPVIATLPGDALAYLLSDLVQMAEGAGTSWRDDPAAAALGDVLAMASLGVRLVTDDSVLSEELRRESHVLRGAAALRHGEDEEALRQFAHALHALSAGEAPLARTLATIGRLVAASDGPDAAALRSAVATELTTLTGRGSGEPREAVLRSLDVRLSARETAARAWGLGDPEAAALLAEWLRDHDPDEAAELRWVTARRMIADADTPETAAARARLLDAAFAAHHGTTLFQDVLALFYQNSGRPQALLAVLKPWNAARPDDMDLALRLAETYRQVGAPEEGAAVLRTLVSEPPVPGEERLTHHLAVLLAEAGSPDAPRWADHLARLTVAEETAALLPSAARAELSHAPRSAPLAAHYADGTLTIDPSAAAALAPGEIQAHIAAAMIVGGPDGEELFRTLAAEAPDTAAQVADLLGIPPGARSPEAPPSEADELFRRAEAHFAQREFDRAVTCYDGALRLCPDHVQALLFLGDVYFVQDRFAVARAYFEESLAVEETPMAWRFLGDALRKTSADTAEVRACYERALALDPGYGGARQALASLPPATESDGGADDPRRDGTEPASPEEPAAAPPKMSRARRAWRRLRRPAAPQAPGRTDGAGRTDGPGSAVVEEEYDALSAAGVRHRMPALIEVTLREREPWTAELLDALTDDDAFARWQDRWLPDRLDSAFLTLRTLSWQWNAKAGETGRALLMAERQVQLATDLPSQWSQDTPEFPGRALLVSHGLGMKAEFLTDFGRYAEALAVLRDAEAWLERDREERELIGRPLTGLVGPFVHRENPRADLYAKLAAAAERCGDAEAAERYDLLADRWREEAPPSDHTRIATLCAQALVALVDGEPDACFRLLDTALPLAVREAGQSPVEHALALVHHTRAQALRILGPQRTALRHAALARRHNSGNADRLASDWVLTAEILGTRPELGDPLEAYEHVLQLSGVAADSDSPLVWRPRRGPGAPVRIENAERAWQVVAPMARAAWAADEPETAIRVLELGVELSDLVRSAQPDPALRRRLQEARAEVYELLVQYRLDSAAASGDVDRFKAAFTATERLRSRTLLETLGTADLRPPDGVPADLIGRESALLRERTALEQAPRTNWARLQTVQRELHALWSEMAALHVSGAEYAEVRSAAAVTAGSALAQLRGEQVVVASYARLDDGRIVLFALDAPSGLTVTPIDADGARLARFVEDNLGSAGQVREMAIDMPGLFQQVLSPLVAPLAALTRPEDTVVICPTGPLHNVPFHALCPDGPASLIERNPVAYLPSVSLLRTLTHRESRIGRGAVVLGDPGGDLPYAREEARLLAARLGTEPLLGADATRRRVLDAMRGAEILHAACHATFRADDPLSSGLALADGPLTGRDILREDWHGVRLAVLSACETGLGGADRSDEVLGLSRSLLFSGVRSLVMSLWRVPDRSTADIMGSFHDLTLAGATPAHALRAAVLASRDRPGGDRLDRWAAFCLLGEWRADRDTGGRTATPPEIL